MPIEKLFVDESYSNELRVIPEKEGKVCLMINQSGEYTHLSISLNVEDIKSLIIELQNSISADL